jgi:uncharacterized integral membrane protein (TIGR00698 family)
MASRFSVVPGILAALAVMVVGFWLADVIGKAILSAQGLTGGGSPISGVPVAIVLGLLIRNVVGVPASLAPGLKFSVTTILRLGIVLVGIRLSAFDVARLGLAGLPVVLAAVSAGLIFVTWFNRRLGLPPRLGTLVAAGTSICGVTAIVSTAPAIEADEREVAYAVANVVAFGLFGMLVYPYVAHALLARSESVGLFLGTAIHDTSQVVGASLTYRQMYADDVVLRVATVTKLTRNLCLAAVIPLLTWMHFRQSREAKHSDRKALSWKKLVPAFIIGFVAMAIVRTIGDAMLQSGGAAFGVWDAAAWNRLTNQIGDFWASRVFLGTAMAAVGLSTSFSVFKGVGAKPFVVGLVGALVVGAVGLAMAIAFGQYVSL